MDTLNRSHLQSLIADQPGHCLTIFTQTQRGGSEQNLIRFRHQLDAAEDMLKKLDVPEGDATNSLKAPRALLKDVDYWKSMSDGLATFIQGKSCQMFRLPLKFDNEIYAGKHFHVKPLIPWFTGDARFYVLAVSQNHVRLLACSAHGVHLVRMSDAPANEAEALRTHDRDEILNVHTHHGASGTMMQKVFHGHGVGIDDHKTELAQYFQKIDQAVCHAIGETHAPLVLATVDYLAAIYRKHSKYPRVMEADISGNPDHLSNEALQAKGLPLATPFLREREQRALTQYREAVGSGKTTHTLGEILPAAYRGELETLLLVHGGQVWGKYEASAGYIEEHSSPKLGDEELTNLASIYMLRHDRRVFSVAPEPVFDGAPMAGIYFLPMPHHGKSRR